MVQRVVEMVGVDEVWDVSVQMFGGVVVETVATVVTVRPLRHHTGHLGGPATATCPSSSSSSCYHSTSENRIRETNDKDDILDVDRENVL